jgi:hypothetical protein
MHQSANYEVINLSGGTWMYAGDLGDGITAATVHRIYCFGVFGGDIIINPIGGGSFHWKAKKNEYIDVVGSCFALPVGFVGIRCKNMNSPNQFNYNG